MRVQIRKIRPEDNNSVMRIIRQVMPEFGAGTFGFAFHDEEVQDMFAAYQNKGSVYFVCDVNGQVVGGGGVGPLLGGDGKICELKKMYFLSESRGKGFGKLILDVCIQAAREMGYRQCYIETFHTMKDAIALYQKYGFSSIAGPLGNTGHFACDIFLILDIPDVNAKETYTPA